MTTVLVTGGAGFIGSHIVDALVASRRHKVRVLDNFSTGRHENLQNVGDRIELLEGDVRGQTTCEQAVEGVDAVLHQAALPSVARSIADPVVTDEVNVLGSLNLLVAAQRAGVRRFVFASSSSIYGDSDELPKHEGMVPNPKSPYAVSKLAAEHYCGVFHALHGLETVALRYFNVFGPRQDPSSQYSGVIALFCTSALAGEPYAVFGDGSQTRDFTYIDNVVRANLLAVEKPDVGGAVLNVACGVRTSLNDMIAVLNGLVGRELPAQYGPPRAGDVAHSAASLERVQSVLGFAPTVDFADGLRRTFDWYRRAAV